MVVDEQAFIVVDEQAFTAAVASTTNPT